MCGNFTDYDKEYLLDGVYYKGEFNVTLDIRSMQRLFEENNLPCFVLDFNQGGRRFIGRRSEKSNWQSRKRSV